MAICIRQHRLESLQNQEPSPLGLDRGTACPLFGKLTLKSRAKHLAAYFGESIEPAAPVLLDGHACYLRPAGRNSDRAASRPAGHFALTTSQPPVRSRARLQGLQAGPSGMPSPSRVLPKRRRWGGAERRRCALAILLVTVSLVGCNAPSTFVVLENRYPASATNGAVVYQAFWQAISFQTPIAPGSRRARRAPLLHRATWPTSFPPWVGPDQCQATDALIVLQSRGGFSVSFNQTLHIPVDDATFAGICAAGRVLSQAEGNFLTDIVSLHGGQQTTPRQASSSLQGEDSTHSSARRRSASVTEPPRAPAGAELFLRHPQFLRGLVKHPTWLWP